MGDHGDDAGEVDCVDATVVMSALIGRHHAGALFTFREVRLSVEHPGQQRIVGFADARSPRAFRRHVAQRGSLVHGEGRESGTTEFHASVEGQFFACVIGEDGENHVLGRATLVEFANQLKTNGFGNFYEGEPGTNEVGVFRGAHAPRQGVGGTSHAGVGVGGLDEIADLDEFLASHLVADAG